LHDIVVEGQLVLRCAIATHAFLMLGVAQGTTTVSSPGEENSPVVAIGVVIDVSIAATWGLVDPVPELDHLHGALLLAAARHGRIRPRQATTETVTGVIEIGNLGLRVEGWGVAILHAPGEVRLEPAAQLIERRRNHMAR
jgi:hypothetical protein